MISVKINIFKDIFSQEYESYEYKRSVQLSELFFRGLLDRDFRYLVIKNDEEFVYPDTAEDVEFADGDIINVRLIPEGKGMGTLSYILGGAMILGGILALPAIGIIASGTAFSAGMAMFGGATVIASQVLADMAPEPKTKGDLGKTYGFSRAQNEAAIGSPFPVVMGKYRITPPLAASYYTSLTEVDTGMGTVQLNGLLCLGYGELTVSDIKVGDLQIIDNKKIAYDSLMETLPNTVKGNVQLTYGHLPSWYGARKKEEVLNMELTLGPKGEYDKGKNEGGVWIEEKYYPPEWYIDPDTEQYVYKPGYTTGGYWEGGVMKVPPHYKYPQAVVCERNVPADVDYVDLQILFAGGLYYFNGASGRLDGAMSGVYVRVFKLDGSEIPDKQLPYRFMNFQNRQLRYTARVDLSEYDEEVKIVISGLTDNGVLEDDKYDSSWNATPTLVSVIFQYKPNMKPVSDEAASKMTFLSFQIDADENTNGILQSVNCTVSRKINVYNMIDWSEKRESSNPAALALDVLRGGCLSKPVPDKLIDMQAFSDLYEWCERKDDEGRPYECNALITESCTVMELLNNILSTCQASFILKGGKYSVAHDREQSAPLAIFTPKNTADFSSLIDTEPAPAAMEITYLDEENGYQHEAKKIYLEGEDNAEGDVIPAEPFGVTSYRMAVKYARYLLACQRYRKETFTFRVPYYHAFLPIGSRVQLQHDTIRLGIASGRIAGADTVSNTIILDENLIALDPDTIYGLKIVRPKQDPDVGRVETLEVKVIGPREVVSASKPVTSDLKGCVYAFGELGKETVNCIIRNKSRISSPKMSAVLELVLYDENIYKALAKKLPPYSPGITYQGKPSSEHTYVEPRRPASAADNLIRRENDGSLTIGGVPPGMVTDIVPPAPIDYVEAEPLADASVKISWTATEDNAGGAGLAGYKIYRCSRPDKTDRAVVIMADKDCLSIVDPTPKRGAGVYYGVSAFDRNNNENAVTWAAETVTPTYVVGPAAPTDLKAAAAKGIICLTWKAPSNAGEVTYYEIEKAENGGEWRVIGQSGTLSFAEEIGRVERAVIDSWLYRVRAYNLYEVYGPFSEAAAVDVSGYGTYIMAALEPRLSPFINSVVISWEKQYELMDLKYVEIERYKAGVREAGFQVTSFYTDSGLVFDIDDADQPVATDYKYRIRQVNEIGEAGPWKEAPVTISPADKDILRVNQLEAAKGDILTITSNYIKGVKKDERLDEKQQLEQGDFALTYVDLLTGRFRFGDLNAYIYGDGEKIAIKSLDMELNSSDLVTNADGIYLKHGGNSLTWGNAGFSTKYVSLSGSAAGINVDGKLSAISLEAKAFRNNADQDIQDVNVWVRPGVYRVQGAKHAPPYENYGNVFVGSSDTDTLFQLYSGFTGHSFYHREAAIDPSTQLWHFYDWGRVVVGDVNGNVGIRTESDSRYSLKVSGESYFGGNMRVTGALSSVRIGINTDADTSYSLKVEGKSNLNGDLNIAGKAYANALGLGVQPDAVYALKVGGGGYFSGDIVASGKISSGGVPVMRAPRGGVFIKDGAGPSATYTVPAGEWLVFRVRAGVLNQTGFIHHWDMEVRRGGYVYEGWPYGSVFYLWKIGD